MMPANTPVKVPSYTGGLLRISTGMAVLMGAYVAAYAFTGTVERSPEDYVINGDGTTTTAPGFVARTYSDPWHAHAFVPMGSLEALLTHQQVGFFEGVDHQLHGFDEYGKWLKPLECGNR